MKLAIVGATGLVGTTILKVLEERHTDVEELILVGSAKSKGRKLLFHEKEIPVILLEEAVEKKPDVAIFSAGSTVSKLWAPRFAEVGCVVIDNSSAWRMEEDVPLIVPEVNAHILSAKDRIIANPNCSTIQMVAALTGLHGAFRIKRLVISTYQSVSGSGKAGIEQLYGEREGRPVDHVYPHPIDLNCLPHGGDFLEDGYTTEEMKLVHETRKIMNAPDMQITATVVRVPVIGGHSESVNVEFEAPFHIEQVYDILHHSQGVTVQDDPPNHVYPMPTHAQDRDEVFVGRIRRDHSIANGLNLWIVSDNLRKGAATNAVQIMEVVRTLDG